jgi:colanic acid biosynthesis protein WcaH
MGWISDDKYIEVSGIMPISAIDLCIADESGRMLSAKRLNSPAKGTYFVPGGRIRHGETQMSALRRILGGEGLQHLIPQERLFRHKGVYDHFYSEGPLGATNKSHYVVNAYYLLLSWNDAEEFVHQIKDMDQHDAGSWKFLKKGEVVELMHPLSYAYYDLI